MLAPQLLSVVIPSYNDAPIVRKFHAAIVAELDKQSHWRWEIVYVDDGSSDDSPDILRDLAAADPRVSALLLLHNFGQQRALFAGLDHARGDVVVTIDGDYQYEPSAILILAGAIGPDVDVVSGIRRERNDPAIDRFFSAIGNAMLRSTLEAKLEDFGSAKAYSRETVERIRLMRHRHSDVLPAAMSLRPRIAEVAVPHLPRPHGRSHWNVWMRVMVLVDTFLLYGQRRTDFALKIGVAMIALAPLLALAGVFAPGPWIAWAAAGVYTATVGGAFVAWTILLRYVVRIHRNDVSDLPYIVREKMGGAPPGSA
jgi:glycosyltransferase involved in cell wall biosynthesis